MNSKTILNKTKKNDLRMYRPLFNFKNTVVEKKEEGYCLICRKETPVLVNGTAYEIINLCDGKNTMNDIIEQIVSKYMVDKNTIKEDLIKTLYLLNKKNLIVWFRKKNFFQILYENNAQNNKFKYKVEQGIEITHLFNQEKEDTIFSDKYQSYNPMNIQKVDSIYQAKFFSMFENGKIKSLLSLKPVFSIHPFIVNYKFLMYYVYMDESLKKEDFDLFINWCIEWLIDELNLYIVAEKAVIDIWLLENNNNCKKIENIGFKLEGRLKKEYKDLDMLIYEKEIKLNIC